MVNNPNDYQAEIKAMGTIAEAVKGLDADARKRVKDWFNDFERQTLNLLVTNLEEVCNERDQLKQRINELEIEHAGTE